MSNVINIKKGMFAVDIMRLLYAKKLKQGDRVALSIKKGKNRKLRSFKIASMFSSHPCNCCPPYNELAFRKNSESREIYVGFLDDFKINELLLK